MTRQQIIDIIRYIRRTEEMLEAERTDEPRDWRQIEADGDMPAVYHYCIDIVGQVD